MFGLTVGVQYCSGIGKFLGKRVVDGFKVATTCVYVLKYAHCFCSLILNILHTLIGTAWYDGTGVGRAGGTRGLCCLTKAGQGVSQADAFAALSHSSYIAKSSTATVVGAGTLHCNLQQLIAAEI